jgi:hypothetical protein
VRRKLPGEFNRWRRIIVSDSDGAGLSETKL